MNGAVSYRNLKKNKVILMRLLISFLIIFFSFLLGAVGFPQIVGTIRFNLKTKSALFTILLWILILGFGAFAVFYWLDSFKTALLIGYAVSFLFSLNTKPD